MFLINICTLISLFLCIHAGPQMGKRPADDESPGARRALDFSDEALRAMDRKRPRLEATSSTTTSAPTSTSTRRASTSSTAPTPDLARDPSDLDSDDDSYDGGPNRPVPFQATARDVNDMKDLEDCKKNVWRSLSNERARYKMRALLPVQEDPTIVQYVKKAAQIRLIEYKEIYAMLHARNITDDDNIIDMLLTPSLALVRKQPVINGDGAKCVILNVSSTENTILISLFVNFMPVFL